MESIQEKQHQAHSNLIIKTVIIGILIGGITAASIFFVVPFEPVESLTVQKGADYTGTLENSVEYYPFVGSTNTTVLSISNFTDHSFRLFHGYGTVLNIEHQSEGFVLSGEDYFFGFETNFVILVHDYNDVKISLDCLVNQGAANVRIITSFPEYSLYEDETFSLTEETDIEIAYEIPLEYIEQNSEQWLLETRLRIEISSETYSEIVVKGISVHVLSDELLYPLNVHFLDQTGFDFLSYEHSSVEGRHPMLNITETSNINISPFDNALISSIVVNCTVYLPVGNYTFDYGWSPSHRFQILGSQSIEIIPNTRTEVSIEVETVRLFIETPRNIPTNIQIFDSDLFPLMGFYDDLLDIDFYLHFPASTIGLIIEYSMAGSWRTLSDSVSIQINDTNDITITLEFPLYQFLGFGFDVGQLLLTLIVLGGFVAALISLKRLLDYGPVKSLVESKESVPLLLIICSILIPWSFEIKSVIDGNKVYSIVEGLNPITGTILRGGSERLWIFIPPPYNGIVIFMGIFGFWVLLILVRIFTGYFSETPFKMLAPYLLLSIPSMNHIAASIIFWNPVTLGPFLTLIAVAVFQYQSKGSKKKEI